MNKEVEKAHASMVLRLAKDGQAVIDGLTPISAHCLHMVVGIAGEAGELLDAVKKMALYEKSLDVTNVIEELGDLEFYMAGLRDRLGISREQTLLASIEKLEMRFGAGKYSNQQAQDRADKVQG